MGTRWGGEGGESKDSHLEVEMTDKSRKSWNKNVLRDQTEEKSEPKKDPNLQTEQAEHISGTTDKRKMTRVEKNSHSFKAEKEKNLVPYMGISTRLALDFVFGAICNSSFLKAVEQCPYRILKTKNLVLKILSPSNSLWKVKATGGCFEQPVFNSRQNKDKIK